MSEMQMLGRIALSHAGGDEVEGLLRQPKRLALLAYLASPTPGTWHRRDTLLALFWSEMDEGRARTALRNALYVLRRNLAEGTIRTRGDDDISLDPALFSTDVATFERACAEGRGEEALAMYQGELLPALYVQEAEGFEKWLDEERRRLRALAHRSALISATTREGRGDWRAAAEALARAVELEPHDEASARKLMALYDGAGDRAQALATFDRLVKRLDEEFGIGPSPETMAMAEVIRTRRVADPAAVAPPLDAVRLLNAPSPTLPSVSPSASPDVSAHGEGADTEAVVAAPVRADRPEPVVRRPAGRRAWRVALVIGVLAIGALAFRVSGSAGHAPAQPRALMLAPLQNAAGDDVAYVAQGLAEELARRLGAISGLRVTAAASLRTARLADSAVLRAGRSVRADVVLDVRLDRAGDSLVASATAIDLASGAKREAGHTRFVAVRTPDAASRLAAAIAGTILRVPLPALPGERLPTSNPDSYRLTILAWRELLSGTTQTARQLFLDAVAADPMNARAHAGLSSTYAAMAASSILPWDEGSRNAIAAAEHALALDSTQGSAWGTMGIMRALGGGGVAEGERLIRKGMALEPANAELPLVLETVYRHTWEWDKAIDVIRVARALDPLESRYVNAETSIQLCAGRGADALASVREGLRADAGNRPLRQLEIRALASLGRWDEALDARRHLTPSTDSLMTRTLATAHGESGYWEAFATDNRRQLAKTLKFGQGGEWVSPWRVAILQIASGDLDAGFDALESVHAAGVVQVLKMPCNPALDHVRNDPRYLALLERVRGERPR